MVLVTADIDIESTAADVLQVLADLPHYPDWSAVHKRVKVDSRGADGLPSRATMAVAAAGLTDEQVLEYNWRDDGMDWSLKKSQQQRDQHGTYVVTQRGRHEAHVHYELEINPLIPLPGFVVRQVMKKAVSSATEGLKKRVESLR